MKKKIKQIVKKYVITFVFCLFIFQTYSNEKEPIASYKSKGSVIDFIVEKDILYAATDHGFIDIISIKTKKQIDKISLKTIKDFTGKIIPAKIFSIDKFENIDELLIVSQGENGFRDVFIYKDKKLLKIIDSKKDKLFIKKAKYINKNTMLLGLVSNEIILLINNKTIVYQKQISTSTFSDLKLNKDKTEAVLTDESGIIRLLKISNGDIIKEYKGNNVDNVYQLDYKAGTIIGAGQDRRVAVYKDIDEKGYYIESEFIIYSVGLSPDGKLGAYAATIDNDIFVFDIQSRKKNFTLKGQKSTLTKIFFLNNNELISSSEDPLILFWKLN